jgi:hypothetical protein
MTPIIDNRD